MATATLDVLFVRTLASADVLKAASAVKSGWLEQREGTNADPHSLLGAAESSLWLLIETLIGHRMDRRNLVGREVEVDPHFQEAVLARQWLEVSARHFSPPTASLSPIRLSNVAPDSSSERLEEAARCVFWYLRRGLHGEAAQYWCDCGAPIYATLLPSPAQTVQKPFQPSAQFDAPSHHRSVVSAFSPLERTHTVPQRAGTVSLWAGSTRARLASQVAASFGRSTDSQPFLSAWHGLLGSNLTSILRVCPSWQDQLWGHLFVLTSRSTDHFSARESTLQALDLLSTSSQDRIRREAQDFASVVARLLIGGTPKDASSLIQLLEDSPPDYIRFAAHLAIFMSRCGLWEVARWADSVARILSRYVNQLIHQRQFDIVAQYVALIPLEDLQVEVYTNFLSATSRESGTDIAPAHREFYLQLAEKAGLNVRRITAQLVDSIIQNPSALSPLPATAVTDSTLPTAPALRIPDSGTLWESLSSHDQSRIQSLEWMAYGARSSSATRVEVLDFANQLAKKYILDANATALAALFEQVESLLPSLLSDVRVDATMQPNMAEATDILLREHICLKQFSELQAAYHHWYSLWLKKPSQPASPVPEEMRQHFLTVRHSEQLRQFGREMEIWTASAASATSRVVASCSALILFPGGWLASSSDAQANDLRRRCVVEAFAYWHRVLLEAGDFAGCLALSNILADPYHQLSSLFTHEAMRDFLRRVQRSALSATHPR